MKVIELLNKIANGEEVPEKILYKETLYTYNEGIDYKNNYGNFLMGGIVCICPEDLNNRVEIIEEPQAHKIPEKWSDLAIKKIHKFNSFHDITPFIETIMRTQNELIDYLEKLK